jgi:hypothetical protein
MTLFLKPNQTKPNFFKPTPDSSFLYTRSFPSSTWIFEEILAWNIYAIITLRSSWQLPPAHLLLDSAPNLGPLISLWEINKFENCWYKSFRILEALKLLFQQFLNLSSSQRDMSGPILGALSNNRWSGVISEMKRSDTVKTWYAVERRKSYCKNCKKRSSERNKLECIQWYFDVTILWWRKF